MYSTLLKYGNLENKQDIMKHFNIQNIHSLPRIKKITLAFPLGNKGTDKKIVESAIKDMQFLSGSKSVVRNAKFSDAALKIREGQPLSVICTLRKQKMMHMLDRIIYAALPRIRDFRGLKPSFDRLGNFTFVISGDSAVFYEVNFQLDLSVSINFINSNPEMSKYLLNQIKIPFTS